MQILSTGIVAISLGLLGLFWPPYERHFRKRTSLRAGLIWGASFFAVFLILHNNLNAKWGPIDDGEVMSFLKGHERLAVADFPRVLMDSEFGHPGARYRPAYYLFRISECVIWGDNPGAWYAARLVIFSIGLALFWSALAEWIGLLGALAFLLYALTLSFWADIWCRMGTAEIYAFLGCAFFTRAAVRIVKIARNPAMVSAWKIWICWVFLILGALAAIGSKENFLILVPFVWLIALIWFYQTRKFHAAPVLALLLTTGLASLIAWSVVKSTASMGTDIYAQDVSAKGRLAVLKIVLVKKLLGRTAVGLVLVLVGWPWVRNPNHEFFKKLTPAPMGPWVLRAGFWVLVLCGFYLLQSAFYNGDMPSEKRYSFPAALTIPLIATVFIWLGYLFIRSHPRLRGAVHFYRAVVLGVAGGIAGWNGTAFVSAASANNAQRTADFVEFLKLPVEELKKDPKRALILSVGMKDDYELAFSIPEFLRAQGVTNPLYLEISWENAKKEKAYDNRLMDSLQAVAASGGFGYEPLKNCPTREQCFVMALSNAVTGGYRYFGQVRPPLDFFFQARSN